MASLNKVLLIGNLTRDPEMRVTPKGTEICQFGIAINRKFKGDDGSARDEVTFVDLEAWAKTAALVSKYLTKGSPVMIEGRLKLDSWEDKETGAKKQKLKVVVENVQFLGSKNGQDSQPQQQPQQTKPAAQENLDEDVPF